MIKKMLLLKRIQQAHSNKLDLKTLNSVFDTIFAELSKILVEGETIQILQFGKFSLRQAKAKQSFNIKQRVMSTIAARQVIKFTPSKFLKAKLNPMTNTDVHD